VQKLKPEEFLSTEVAFSEVHDSFEAEASPVAGRVSSHAPAIDRLTEATGFEPVQPRWLGCFRVTYPICSSHAPISNCRWPMFVLFNEACGAAAVVCVDLASALSRRHRFGGDVRDLPRCVGRSGCCRLCRCSPVIRLQRRSGSNASHKVSCPFSVHWPCRVSPVQPASGRSRFGVAALLSRSDRNPSRWPFRRSLALAVFRFFTDRNILGRSSLATADL